jgi:hypothetical protein
MYGTTAQGVKGLGNRDLNEVVANLRAVLPARKAKLAAWDLGEVVTNLVAVLKDGEAKRAFRAGWHLDTAWTLFALLCARARLRGPRPPEMEGAEAVTPTARTLAFLRRCHHTAEVVERWLPKANVRRDLFGFIDVVGVRRGEAGVLGVQATTRGHLPHRRAKAAALPALRTWLAAENRFQLHGWYRQGDKWEVKIVELRPEDLAAVVVQAPPRRGRKPVQAGLFDGMG